MNKYINADELMEIIKTHHYMLANAINSRDYGMFTTGIAQAISETESVEVVRCKDCKYYEKSFNGNYRDYCEKHSTMEYTEYVNPTDFCSKGERKEVE